MKVINGTVGAMRARINTKAKAMIQDVVVRVDPEDTEGEVVAIVVAKGDILGILGTQEDSRGGVVKEDVTSKLVLKLVQGRPKGAK